MRRGRLNFFSDKAQSVVCLVAAPHSVIEIEDVHLDLVSGVVTREMRHFQHVYDAARISIAPFDKLVQHMIEI